MKELWNAWKEKRKDKRIRKEGEKALHYIQENEKLERQIANLLEDNTEEMMKNTKTGSAEDQGQPQDAVTREKYNAESDTLQEENTLEKEKASEQLRNEARQLMSYVTPYTLLPGQEKQWYRTIAERVEAIQDKSVAEILSALLPHIVQHPEIEKRLRQQLKKSRGRTFDKTIGQCLNKIMKGYISQEEPLAQDKNLANSEKLKELTSTTRNNDTPLLISGNAAIVDSVESPDPIRKVKKTIRKRCHCCKKRGHLIKNCPIRKCHK